MHYLVKLIVEAKDKEEASGKAYGAMQELTGQNEFDWFAGSNDSSRWKACWSPAKLSSSKARQMVGIAMNEQLAEFKRVMQGIRAMTNDYTDEQIFNENFQPSRKLHLSRHLFDVASGYHSYGCQVFGEGGAPISSFKELDYYLDNSDNYWLVLVDAHS